MLTAQTVTEMYLAAQYVRLYKLDDIYASILAYLLHIPALHNENMHFYYYSINGINFKDMICIHGYYGDNLRETYRRLEKRGLMV